MNEEEFIKEHPSMGHCLDKNVYVSNEGLRQTIHNTQIDKQRVKEILELNQDFINWLAVKQKIIKYPKLKELRKKIEELKL